MLEIPLKTEDIGYNKSVYPKGSYIYVIWNTINNKTYLGSALAIKNRIDKHRYDLRNNKHHSIKLQRAYNKYGENSFMVILVEEVNRENILSKEQEWLKKHVPHIIGYNISSSAISALGRKLSQEHKEKIRIANTGKKSSNRVRKLLSNYQKGRTGELNHRSKKVIQYDYEMNKLSEYSSITEASIKTNINRNSINNNLKLRSNSAGNYIWKYKEEVSI